MKLRLHLPLLLAGLLAAGACKKTETTPAGEEAPTTAPSEEARDQEPAEGAPERTDTAATGAGSAATPPPAGSAAVLPKPTDDQILHILTIANDADVEGGRLAKSKSKNPLIQSFGDQMVKDHTAADEKGKELARIHQITPADNETSTRMKEHHDAVMARLEDLDGEAFDRAYIEHEVAMHAEVLDTIDRILLPNAQRPELVALINEVRPTIAAHLSQAQQLQKQLSQAPTPTL